MDGDTHSGFESNPQLSRKDIACYVPTMLLEIMLKGSLFHVEVKINLVGPIAPERPRENKFVIVGVIG
jgi:hypothetical protein